MGGISNITRGKALTSVACDSLLEGGEIFYG